MAILQVRGRSRAEAVNLHLSAEVVSRGGGQAPGKNPVGRGGQVLAAVGVQNETSPGATNAESVPQALSLKVLRLVVFHGKDSP